MTASPRGRKVASPELSPQGDNAPDSPTLEAVYDDRKSRPGACEETDASNPPSCEGGSAELEKPRNEAQPG
jgi:hypothetical protein